MIGRIAALALATALIPAPAGAKVAVTQACSENVAPVATAPLTTIRDGKIWGRIELRRDTCHQYWAYLKLNSPITSSSSRATAVLVYWEDGVQRPGFTCNSPGGNGYITVDQTSCRTGKISWTLIDAFMATGHYDILPEGGAWTGIATGRTERAPGDI
ncbi:hypothetical protein OHB24_08555 [Kribbella sp. NBC_00482]|uniref:hypothetical protein n=1 Tax=Kribbella sp. NBC_00482 TaxID=2975968 RepID=UPI002E18AFE2